MSTTSRPPSSTFLRKAHVAPLADEVTACRTRPSTAGAPKETARTTIHPELPLGQGLPPTLPAHDPRRWDCHLAPTLQMKIWGTQHPRQRRAKCGRGIFRLQFWPPQCPPLCPETSGHLPCARVGHQTVCQVLAVHRFEEKTNASSRHVGRLSLILQTGKPRLRKLSLLSKFLQSQDLNSGLSP